MGSKQVREGHERLTTELKNIDKSDISNLDDFLRKYATILPDCSQLSREIQYNMMLMMKSKDQSIFPTNILLKKTIICKDLLDLADKIEPGMTKWRGQILFEYQSASVVLAQRAVDEAKLDKWKAKVFILYKQESKAKTVCQRPSRLAMGRPNLRVRLFKEGTYYV